MLNKIKNKLVAYYNTILSSIAFYPTLISVSLLLLAFLLVSIEDKKLTQFLLDNASFLVISDSDTARAILATLIGGLISLTVFSFSMVMVLLNQASSNFSPRLLPGLISDKRNQIVLGFYLGTIVYNIIVLISILPTGDAYLIKGFSILIGIVLGIVSLALFVFFIHSISTNIQINFILERIYKKSKNRLDDLIKKEKEEPQDFPKDTSSWFPVKTDKAGYFYGINVSGLFELSKQLDSNFEIVVFKDFYLLPNTTVILSEKDLSEEEVKQVKQIILFNGKRDPANNFVLGIKQITEVGIKAMSPGINDPGTAIMSIDYLTELLALRMQLQEVEVYCNDEDNYKIQIANINFEPLLYNCLAAYRQYCKHDILLLEKLIVMLQYLKEQPSCKSCYIQDIEDQIEIIKSDFKGNITNKSDQKRLMELIGN